MPKAALMRVVGALAGTVALLAGCSLPPRGELQASTAFPAAGIADTWLARATLPGREAHPDRSAILPLTTGLEAFAARVKLMRSAQLSLDLQYYIWHRDLTGKLLLAEAVAAADRGVRVRLLVDDNGIADMDALLAAADAHPSIEIRIFNPFPTRRAKWIGFLTDFNRVNRRMHSKSLTADGVVTIVGGRNIGDEYFDAAGDTTFADLDVVAVGPVADAVSIEFDRFWNSDFVWPVSPLIPPASAQDIEHFTAAGRALLDAPEARAYVASVHASTTISEIRQRIEQTEWVSTRLFSDPPDKAAGKLDHSSLLFGQLMAALPAPASHFDLVSPYFVPTRSGAEGLASLAKRGVKVRILTNSLQANDVAVVHAGYAKWRRTLLEAGVELYELRPLNQTNETNRASQASQASASRGESPSQGSAGGGLMGSSSASLHAKTFTIDGRELFVGSFNFDPRSAELNTELGVVMRDSALAGQMQRYLEAQMPRMAWQVSLDADGRMRWTSVDAAGRPEVHDSEPDTPWYQRGLLRVVAWLPIDWLL